MSRTAYITHRPLKVDVGGGKVVEIAPGEEVPDFGQWPNEAKQAHLSQEIVTLETIDEKPKPAASASKKTGPKKSPAKR